MHANVSIWTEVLAKSWVESFIKSYSWRDIREITEWEISVVSPFEVSSIWTAKIKQKIPCSVHKHVWEISALNHVVCKSKRQEDRITQSSHERSPAAHSSLWGSAQRKEESGRGWHSLQLGVAKRISKHFCRRGQYKMQQSPVAWAVMKTEAQPQSGNCHSRQRNKVTQYWIHKLIRWKNVKTSIIMLKLGINNWTRW